ncbi:hypothetical protein [Pseudomonas uvaldensis]|uniref:hypothetical protein n=1 Tax=Pseudomonas uvaldensis TaxID=2878385 RepID=UPI001E462E2F|nr:hypothetical protein [Pseudomonas uvaldensis]MCE0464851.1 hypothetical protein [Pseudomonas uvaldensis]
MPAENKIAPNIQLALDYSRSFATAKPNIGLTEKEHIEGLANLLERTATENQALQARLTVQDQRVDELEAALKFYADGEHYHFESGNWDTVSGEPTNILWCWDEPDFIEDGTVARAALNPTAEAASHVDCGSCRNITDGCKGKCQRAEEWSKP